MTATGSAQPKGGNVMVVADLVGLAIEGFQPYSEARRKLASLREQLESVRVDYQALARQSQELDAESIRVEASVMIDEAEPQTALAVRKKADQARAKSADVQRKVNVLEAAIAMQEAKVAALLPDAKKYIQQTAKTIHEPVIQRILHALRAYASAVREHEKIISVAADSLGGGLYGSLIQPNGPDLRSVETLITELEMQMRVQGYSSGPDG